MTRDDINSLAHSKWNCKYHIVFAPKYRRMVIYNQIKVDIGKILRRLCEQKGVEIIEAGLSEAIKSIFPKTKNQLCIIHQIRNSCKFVPYKDRKAVCADLKKIYGAVNLDDAEYAKEEFREKWDKKYPNILKSWDKDWAELTTFFEYPQEIRRIIYTTNAVEGYHRMVRKFTKSKSIFPTDDSIRKVIYISIREITKKWTMPVKDWGLAYAQFMIYFEDRFEA